jgi:hypothetical protein
MKLTSPRIVGPYVFADHESLPSIDVTRYLTRESVDALMLAEAERRIKERQDYLKACRDEFQADALLNSDGIGESLAMLARIPRA